MTDFNSMLTAAQELIWQLIHPKDGAEMSANALPKRYFFQAGDARRFGVSPSNTPAQNAAGFNEALSVGGVVAIEGADARGTYFVDSSLLIPKNTVFRVGSGITIKGANDVGWLDRGIIEFLGDSSALELYGTVDGNSFSNPYGRAIGVKCAHSYDILITGNGKVINCPGADPCGTNGGDGIYISNSSRVTVGALTLHGNVRQGVSVISGEDITFIGTRCGYTAGSNPGAGINIESDNPGSGDLRNIILTGVNLYNNDRGLQIADAINVIMSGGLIRYSRTNDVNVVRSKGVELNGRFGGETFAIKSF